MIFYSTRELAVHLPFGQLPEVRKCGDYPKTNSPPVNPRAIATTNDAP
jgi:hypothetical protein